MIAVIDVSGNNLTSLGNALEYYKCDYVFTHSIETIKNASKVILPGVGSATAAMESLKKNNLVEVLQSLSQPVLGICLGMQLLMEHSEEGDVDCLGLIPGKVKKIPAKHGFPVPHMGWNTLEFFHQPPILKEIRRTNYVYFVHSYALMQSDFAVATCQYSIEFTAMVQKGNIYGMQFHPEKSGATGFQLLKNFLNLEKSC